jgi:glycosyltransferase involved in cell wall biosynthesis
MEKIKLAIYHQHTPELGGIETAIYSLIKQLDPKKFEIVYLFLTNTGTHLVKKWSKYATIQRLYDGMPPIHCDICLIASNYPEHYLIKARKFIQWIHADYELYSLPLVRNPHVTRYITVSEHVSKVSKRLFNVPSVVIMNMLDPDFGKGLTRQKQKDKRLHLITASRISPEKGFERMPILAKMLCDEKIPFVWDVYGNTPDLSYKTKVIDYFKDIPEVVFHGYCEDMAQKIKDADYLVQLSDHEGCCYSILESLQLETSVITTDYNTAFEHVKDGCNGYIIRRDMTEIDIRKIAEKIPKDFSFNPRGTIEQWNEILTVEKAEANPEGIQVRVIEEFSDVNLGRTVKKGEKYFTTFERAEALSQKNLVELLYIEKGAIV